MKTEKTNMTKNTDKAKGLWSLNPTERAEERKAQLRKVIVEVEDRPAVTLTNHVYNRKTMAYEPKGLGRSHETKSQIADERDSLCVKLGEAKRQRDRGLAHASELAKALRGLMSNDFAHGTISKRDAYRAEALDAMAEWSRYSLALREVFTCTQPYEEAK